MNDMEAILFLKKHQPLPPDIELTQPMLDELEEIRVYFLGLSHPNAEALPYLLRVFGDGDGSGIYQRFYETIAKFPKELVIQNLIECLQNEHDSVKSWNAEIAVNYPDTRLIIPLSRMLISVNSDVRWAAVFALSQIEDSKSVDILRNHYLHEDNTEIREILKHIFDN